MQRTYSVSQGVFSFPGDLCLLRIHKPKIDRFDRLWAYTEVMTPDGAALLAMDQGDLLSGQFQHKLAGMASQRNSGDTLGIANVIMDAAIALKSDPYIAQTLTKPAFQTMEDFIRGVQPPGPEVVEGLIERGGLYGFASKPKAGKTILVLNLAISVVWGMDWLGRKVEAGRVCLFQLEDSGRTIKRRMLRMTAGNWPADLLIHAEPFRLCEENYDATVAACRGASLIICDPIIQAAEIRDWNSQTEVRSTYEFWRRLARDTDAAVVISAHHRKMAGDYGDQMAGSIQAQATVDGIIELHRDPNLERTERRLSYTGRDWLDVEDEVIKLDTSTLTWQPNGTFKHAKEMQRESKLQERAEKMLAILPSEEPGKTYRELEAATSWGRDMVRGVIDYLDESLNRTGKARSRTEPLRFWKK